MRLLRVAGIGLTVVLVVGMVTGGMAVPCSGTPLQSAPVQSVSLGRSPARAPRLAFAPGIAVAPVVPEVFGRPLLPPRDKMRFSVEKVLETGKWYIVAKAHYEQAALVTLYHGALETEPYFEDAPSANTGPARWDGDHLQVRYRIPKTYSLPQKPETNATVNILRWCPAGEFNMAFEADYFTYLKERLSDWKGGADYKIDNSFLVKLLMKARWANGSPVLGGGFTASYARWQQEIQALEREMARARKEADVSFPEESKARLASLDQRKRAVWGKIYTAMLAQADGSLQSATLTEPFHDGLGGCEVPAGKILAKIKMSPYEIWAVRRLNEMRVSGQTKSSEYLPAMRFLNRLLMERIIFFYGTRNPVEGGCPQLTYGDCEFWAWFWRPEA